MNMNQGAESGKAVEGRYTCQQEHSHHFHRKWHCDTESSVCKCSEMAVKDGGPQWGGGDQNHTEERQHGGLWGWAGGFCKWYGTWPVKVGLTWLQLCVNHRRRGRDLLEPGTRFCRSRHVHTSHPTKKKDSTDTGPTVIDQPFGLKMKTDVNGYLVGHRRVAVFKRQQGEWAGVNEGPVQGPRFPVHQSQDRVGHVILCQVWGKQKHGAYSSEAVVQRTQMFFCHPRLAQLRGVDIPLFMMSSVPSSPGPCTDTSIFSMRGYRALCLACSRENTALRWLRISAVGGRMAAAAEAKPEIR